jgi:hypothetical protein
VHQPTQSFSAADVASANLRLVEAVAARRRTLSLWPQTIAPYLQRLFARPPISATKQSAEAQVLFIIARRYGPTMVETDPLRTVIELIALQGEVTVVQRTLWGVGFADNALQKALMAVIPEFKALVGRYPTVFCAADSLGFGFAKKLRDCWNRRAVVDPRDRVRYQQHNTE